MQITIYNLKTDKSLSKEEAINLAIKKYKISPQNIKDAKLVKKSLDLREKNNPIYVYQFIF